MRPNEISPAIHFKFSKNTYMEKLTYHILNNNPFSRRTYVKTQQGVDTVSEWFSRKSADFNSKLEKDENSSLESNKEKLW